MRFTPSIFGKLLEPIKRRRFDTLVARASTEGGGWRRNNRSWHDPEVCLMSAHHTEALPGAVYPSL